MGSTSMILVNELRACSACIVACLTSQQRRKIGYQPYGATSTPQACCHSWPDIREFFMKIQFVLWILPVAACRFPCLCDALV